jgi:hypothetical protein
MKQRFSFSFLIFCLFYCFFFDSFYACGQTLNCIKWAKGLNVTEVYLLTIPTDPKIYAGAGVSMGLTLRFGDLDKMTDECTKGVPPLVVDKQFEPTVYSISFSTESADAGFGTITTKKIKVSCAKYGNDVYNGIKYIVMSNDDNPVMLKIKDDWDGKTEIVVNATIEDNPSNPDAKDDDYTYSWTILLAKDPPTKLKLTGSLPKGADNIWLTSSGPKDQANFDYQGLPDIGAVGVGDYTNQILTEKFSVPLAEDMFTLDDIIPSWLVLPSINIMDADGVAQFAFVPGGNPGTFLFDNEDKIYDTHSLPLWNYLKIGKNQLTNIFTAEAIEAGKIGFKTKQDYVNSTNTTIGSTELMRRANATVTVASNGKKTLTFTKQEFKKIHKL